MSKSPTFVASVPDTARTGGNQHHSAADPSSPSRGQARKGEGKCALAAAMRRNDLVTPGGS